MDIEIIRHQQAANTVPGGYTGKLLRVNLTHSKITIEELKPALLREYLGGTGLGIRLVYNEVKPQIDPLGPEAKLVIATGPVTATALGTAGRFQVVFKSPLTGILCDSSSGGHWGAMLKYSGFDVLVVEGQSAEPVFLYVHDCQAELRSATHLWGTDAYQTRDQLRDDLGENKASVLCIGPAGEKLVTYASMVNDAGRVAARGGAGAVMGSKKLKAIVVYGTLPVELADPQEFKRLALAINKQNATSPSIATLRELGTPRVMNNNWPLGDIPVKNWSVGSYEEICTNLGGKKMRDTILVEHNACHFCSIGCSRWVNIRDGEYQMDAPGPEFETLGALGSLCLVDDLNAVSYAAHLCNIYGLDTITAGTSIAFAMECYEKGLISEQDTGGLALNWGDKNLVIELVRKIAFGEGFGRFLGLGTRRMAEILENGSLDFAVQTKGMEYPLHDPRAFFSWAATYATSPRGGCHLHGMSSIYENKDNPLPEWGLTGNYPRQTDAEKGKIARLAQNWSHILDSMVVCYFATFTLQPSDLAALINAATGFDLSTQDLLDFGDRINALYRAYNYRCGIRRADDTLPKRVLTPLAEGGTNGLVPNLESQLEEYYQVRDWEPDGKPSRRSLTELGLDFVVADLYP